MLRAARARYAAQKALSAATARDLARLWALLDPGALDASFTRLAAPLTQRVATAQLLAASLAAGYLEQALAEQQISAPPVATVAPAAFTGVASDGRPLASLLLEPLIATKVAIGTGLAPDQALGTGLASLLRIGATQVADAGRGAESVGIVARPRVGGYVRMLNPPSCARCAVLAGRFYRWNAGFQRHPHCDCLHIPSNEDVAGDLRTDPAAAVAAGQVTGLSQADTRAIVEDKADVSQVINAHRGMYTADVFGRTVKASTEGTTSRGVAGRRMGGELRKQPGARYRSSQVPRLRPEAIYRLAGDDRTEAIRLLTRFGYLT